jgi:hypothetical protein
MCDSSIEYQQKRGAGWDIVDEAINTYDQWMLDDNYEFAVILRQIIGRMKERRAFYHPQGAHESSAHQRG